MFREKMVDFMLPADDRTRYKGWRYPRTINARSYYHFSDANGLDSVSDRCNQHFSWSDWVGMIPEVKLPAAIAAAENATDTLRGRYRPVEIWNRSGGHRLAVDIDVTADTLGRRWVPGISAFSRTRPIDFERFTMRLNYNGVDGPAVTPLDLTGYSFNIESRGRGDGIFLFNRPHEPKFVTTYAEVYMVDKEYITVKEARKWESRKFDTEALEIIEPPEAPDLSPAIAALVDRVSDIDYDYVRSAITPDTRMKSRRVVRQHFGQRALSLLKTLTGISRIRSNRRTNKQWRDFRSRQVKANNSRPLPPAFEVDSVSGPSGASGREPGSAQ